MSKQNQTTQESRRRFLRESLTLGTGAVTLALTANTVAAAVTEQTPETIAKPAQKGYHLTQHIADYYKTAAF
jgi:hypothetical protein